MFLKRIFLLGRTVFCLKQKQIVYRLWYMFRAKAGLLHVPPPENNHDLFWNDKRSTLPFLHYRQWSKNEIENRTFEFLNESVDFGDKIDWHPSEQGRLWKYNLHYFQYLLLEQGIYPDYAVDFIKDWIENNPAGTADAWDPFPISLRLVNWIKFFCQKEIPEKDKLVLIDSMVFQARWLVKHLEYHLLGNHLFKNGKALIFMGIFFPGKEAEKWLQKGLKIVNTELDEQILEDGGHFERSPMYHSMILEDCLDLLNVLQVREDDQARDLVIKLEEKTRKMVSFLSAMCHPDGQISLFNDAAFGIEAAPSQLLEYYERLTGEKIVENSENLFAFPASGYYILQPDDKNKMILDCGPVGPVYQPGHSHCDTLSFELSVKGRRVVVDSGCYQYVDSPIRQYNRGNIGHNTITVDDENQSEVWGAHRCARKAMPIDAACRLKENGDLFFRGGHDGYKRLRGKPVHYRSVTFQDRAWTISDQIAGKGRHTIASRLHLHPSMEIEFNGDHVLVSVEGEKLLKIQRFDKGVIHVEKGWYCPEFGKKYACDVLVYKNDKTELPFECGWIMELEK
jgi:uncharacterized heparinase superfamily protein